MRQTADRGALQVDARAQVAGSPVAWLLLENKGWGPILAEQQGRGSVREGAVQGEGVESFAGSTRSSKRISQSGRVCGGEAGRPGWRVRCGFETHGKCSKQCLLFPLG